LKFSTKVKFKLQPETFDCYPNPVYPMPIANPGWKAIKARKFVKSYTLTWNGYLLGSIEFSYAFGSKNRISTITQTTDDGTVGIQTFTYF